jgi:parallel beta-helix repeat protein
MSHSIKSRNLFFLTGLVLLILLLPGAVSAQIVKTNFIGGSGNTTITGDWNGDGKEDIGISNGVIWYLDFNGNGVWNAGIDKVYNFGSAGWTPVTGDWNGDDHFEIGVCRNGVWYLDYDGNGVWNAGIDKAYNFGSAGWTPVTGDWNKDGRTEAGVYQNGVWYLDYNGNGMWNAGIDKIYNFGGKGWTPLVEDWNGDGKTKVGVYQNGIWYLDYTGNGAWNASADKIYSFGSTGWTPVPGDWNEDGRTEVGTHRNGVFQLDYNGNGVWNGATSDKQVNFGITGYTPKAGDWNNDGKTKAGLTNGITWYLDNGDAAPPSATPSGTPAASSPSITVTATNGGESWARGTAHTLTWSYTGSPGSTVKIEVLKGSTPVGTIAESAPIGSGGKGSYTWSIFPSGSTGNDYKIRVQSISQPEIQDLSNNFFTITSGTGTSPTATPGTTVSSITVTAANGGEIWKRGTSHAVTWSYTGSPGSAVKIEVMKGSTLVGTIAESVPIGSGGKGSCTWSIFPSGSTGDDYKIRVQSISQPAIQDLSNNFFTLTSGTVTTPATTPATTPGTPISSITVTAPNGGEIWKRGTSHAVTWSYTGSPGSTVTIEIFKGSSLVGTIAENVPLGNGGKGTYTWPIYASGTTGSDYRVSIRSTTQAGIKDAGNNFFTLTPATGTSPTTTPSTTPIPKPDPVIITSGSSLYIDQYGIKGDGSDEGPAIQAAFNYAASHSIKTVIFPAGKVITTGSLRIPKGLTLIGNGCTLRLKANAHTDTSPWTWIYVQDGCRVSGFKFDGNRFNGNGMNTNGLMLQGNNIFDSNEVFNCNSYAVFVYGSYPTNIRITNNYIHDVKQYGIDTGGSDGPSSWGYNVVVTGNTITNCGEVGIKIRGTKDSTISNNNIKVGARNPGGDEPSGIRLYSWDETNTNVKITNNIVTGIDQNPSACIDSDDSDNHGISITGNKVSHCYDGIEIQFNNGIITGNTISNCVKDLMNYGSGNTISANTILA